MKYFLVLLLLLLVSCNQKSPIFHKSHYPKKQTAPFSDVVEVNNMLFLSGQIGMNHNTRELVKGGLLSETTQAIDNIEEVLKRHNSSLERVVKVTVILSDMDDFKEFNEIYKKKFPNKPARTTFAASGLARNALIEIEVVAVKN